MRVLRASLAALLFLAMTATTIPTALAGWANHRSLQTPARSSDRGSRVVTLPATATPTIATVTTGAPIASGRLLVRLKGSATVSALSSLARSADTSVGAVSDIHHGRMSWRVPRGRSPQAFAKQLVASGKVEYAVPDYIRQVADYVPPAYVPPNDPAFTSTSPVLGYSDAAHRYLSETFPDAKSWWLRDVRAPQAWAEGYTGSDIIGKYPLRAGGSAFTVAVIDTGLYTTHPDAGVNIVGGRDFFSHQDVNGAFVQDNDVTPVDPSVMSATDSLATRQAIASHGTCIAGELGATANNGLGTVGIGYDTQVVVHKTMGIFRDGTVGFDDGAICDAIYYSTDNGAKVINMSLGGYDYSQALADAIAYAHDHGVVVVAAKGNDGTSKAFYPAANANVVSVGALDKNANAVTVPASFSNYHKTGLDMMAPGAFIWGLFNPSLNPDPTLAGLGYSAWDGTSMASPIVAGGIAWLWRAAPALNAAEITNVVLGSAAKKAAAKNYPSGYRELDMYAAYKTLEASYPLLGKPSLVDQTVASLGQIPVQWGVPTSPVRGVTYNVTLNGSALESTTSATSGSYAWTPGDYVLAVQADSIYNWDDGTATATATVHVLPLASGPSAWSAAHVGGGSAISATPAYHQATAIDATLGDASATPVAGASVVLESSTNGVAFSPTGIAVSELPNGVYRAWPAPERRTFYRLRFDAADGADGSVSSAAVVTPKVSLSTPASKSSISHTKRLAVTGTLRPAHATSSRAVRLKLTRWNGHQWAAYSSAWTRATYRGSYSSYSATLKLRRGGYRIYAFAPGDSLHAETTSGFKSVLVK